MKPLKKKIERSESAKNIQTELSEKIKILKNEKSEMKEKLRKIESSLDFQNGILKIFMIVCGILSLPYTIFHFSLQQFFRIMKWDEDLVVVITIILGLVAAVSILVTLSLISLYLTLALFPYMLAYGSFMSISNINKAISVLSEFK